MAFRAARATLLFPRDQAREVPPERESRPSLDSVGAVNVLNAMVQQRRRSQPPPPPLDLALEEESPDESQQRPIVTAAARSEKKSIGFIKIR